MSDLERWVWLIVLASGLHGLAWAFLAAGHAQAALVMFVVSYGLYWQSVKIAWNWWHPAEPEDESGTIDWRDDEDDGS